VLVLVSPVPALAAPVPVLALAPQPASQPFYSH
jgi:hypothetical protein